MSTVTKKRRRAVDHIGFIKRTLAELTGFATLAFELIQNADDTQRATWLRFDIRDEALWVEDNGGFTDCGDQDLDVDECPFLDEKGHRCDFHSFCKVSGEDKRMRGDVTGAMGIGFTAVYQVTDKPEILSGERHWIVDELQPEDERIDEELLDPPHEGTRVVLPWASDPESELRRKLDAPAVSSSVRDELLRALDEAIAPAMLFLRNLDRIDLSMNGEPVRKVVRVEEGDELIIDDGGQRQRWRVLKGGFEDDAASLRAMHDGRIEGVRSADVSVAIPIGFGVDGRLCSTLPTGRHTELPVHVNGELYLKSDRRQLSMEAVHHREWNRAAISCGASLLANALDGLPAALGPERLWSALEMARALTQAKHPDAVTEALAAFWEELDPAVPECELVWTSDGRWVRVSEARFAQSAEDEPSFPVLEAAGLSMVHPSLRPRQNILRAVGVEYLSVGDIGDAMRGLGLDEATAFADLPAPLDAPAGRRRLWEQLGRMVDRMRSDEQRAAARAALADAAVAPSTGAELCPLDDLWRCDRQSIQLLVSVASDLPFLDERQLKKEAAALAALCEELTASDVVAELEGRELDLSRPVAGKLVGWFARREDELDDDAKQKLSTLPIFPSPSGVHRLEELALPGDFDDPLGLALLVDRATSREHGAFLERLGAQRLSLAVYASEQVPRAFESDALTAKQRRAVVSLLAQRRGEVEDDPDVLPSLEQVALVECLDGRWRCAEEVYFDTEAVSDVLGTRVARAVLPNEHTLAVEDFLSWLGVAPEPRSADLIERATQLAEGSVSRGRKPIERIVSWLGGHWVTLEEPDRMDFAALREMEWLPARGSSTWHAPDELALVYRDYLYESQALFLNVARPVQTGSGPLLRWLGLTDDPRPDQVVDHLLDCAENGRQPNLEVYRFLTEEADDPAVEKLRGAACLHIDGKWLRPDQVYWAEHPFGEWRFKLGHEFSRYRPLLHVLDVKETPDHVDAIAVIREIAATHGPSNSAVSEEDLQVLLGCWQLCEEALVTGDLGPEHVRELGSEKVVADERGILMRPGLLYFEDLPGLAEELPGIRTHVIRRPTGAWRAMQAAGVQDLSKEAVARVVEAGERLASQEFERLIDEREEELARVIGPTLVRSCSWSDVAEWMRGLRWIPVSEMTVAWELDVFGQRFAGDPHAADALWQRQEEVLYVAVRDGDIVWEAVARELVRATLPDLEPAQLSLGIATALSAPTQEAARRALTAAGYPQLARELRAQITAATADDLDADEPTGADPEAEQPDGDQLPSDEEVAGDSEEESEFEEGDDLEGVDGDTAEEGGEDFDEGDRGTDDSEGDADGTGEPDFSKKGAPGRRQRSRQRQSRLRSYVIGGNGAEQSEGDDQASDDGRRSEVDEAGVYAVVAFERTAGRVPEVQPHNNPGYDVLSEYPDGEVARYIEVKSSEGPWDELGVGLSPTQFTHAQRIEDSFWLYVVEYALDPERRRIWPIPDPARRVTDFMFDDGWKDAAELGPRE